MQAFAFDICLKNTMKAKPSLIVFFILALFSACRQTPETSTRLQSTDSLAQLWIDAWNARDMEAITTCFSPDALLITDTVYKGLEDIKAGFITPAVPVFRNLTCTKLGEQISDDLAWQSGRYTHEWIKKDSTIEKASGYYSMVWNKQADKSWSLVVFHTN